MVQEVKEVSKQETFWVDRLKRTHANAPIEGQSDS